MVTWPPSLLTLCPPTAVQVWIDMARVVNGEALAHNVIGFCIVGALLASLAVVYLTCTGRKSAWFLPNGIAFAIVRTVAAGVRDGVQVSVAARLPCRVRVWVWRVQPGGDRDTTVDFATAAWVSSPVVVAPV